MRTKNLDSGFKQPEGFIRVSSLSTENFLFIALSCTFLGRIEVTEKQQGWIQKRNGNETNFWFFIKRLYLGVGRVGDIEESATPHLIDTEIWRALVLMSAGG